MLIVFTLAVMLLVAYRYWQEGLFNSVCMLVSVFLAGLISFNFWEPLAGFVESLIERTFIQGCEDFVCMILLFAVVLGALRAFTHSVNNVEIEFLPMANQVGGAVVALFTGYLLSGFLICALETLPWHQNFLGFEPYQENEVKLRRYFPPDRVWLALMHRAGSTCLARDGTPTFDPEGKFEGNYFRDRRYADAPPETTKQ